jgi:Icc-related predicted phosphoesterase
VTACLFASDLHGRPGRYARLVRAIGSERPDAVFLGGDLLPMADQAEFLRDGLVAGFQALRETLGSRYPRVFLILGNDDRRSAEEAILEYAGRGLWEYVHMRKATFAGFTVYGYAHVPPTPFRLKDWERYDVSRYVDPGCVPPEEGSLTVPVDAAELRYGTIEQDLARLAGSDDLERAILLCHGPPYLCLDRAALDGVKVDHAPLDVHVGSVALRRFIEARQPLVTLHGHVHESARLTGSWRARIGRTFCLGAAHDGEELALVRFDPHAPEAAARALVG